MFRPKGEAAWRCGVAIGDAALDLRVARDVLGAVASLVQGASLNALMAHGREASTPLRHALSRALDVRAPAATRGALEAALTQLVDVEMALPAQIGAFTDFFTSAHHARRAGLISRPDQPLPPAFKHLPMAYNSRASTVSVAHEFARPWGILPAGDAYEFAPTKALDYELEVGAYVSRGVALGEMVALEEAAAHLFGLCLVNDWSARDIQKAESFPLGPFLADAVEKVREVFGAPIVSEASVEVHRPAARSAR